MKAETINISTVLSDLLTHHRISEAELGRKIDVPRATINRLAAGRTLDPRSSTLTAIAKYFGISLDQLLGKTPLYNEASAFNNTGPLPVLDWNKAPHWDQFVNNKMDITEYVNTDQYSKKSLFALELKGESMWPQFQENTVLIIDPYREPKNKDFVIAQVLSINDIFFRKLVIDGSYKFLVAINTDFPKINLTNKDKIIGVVIQTVKNF